MAEMEKQPLQIIVQRENRAWHFSSKNLRVLMLLHFSCQVTSVSVSGQME